jgi:hypothetical protein
MVMNTSSEDARRTRTTQNYAGTRNIPMRKIANPKLMYNGSVRIHANLCLHTMNLYLIVTDLHPLTKSTFISLGYAKIYVRRSQIRIHAHQVGAGLHRACEISLRSSFHRC